MVDLWLLISKVVVGYFWWGRSVFLVEVVRSGDLSLGWGVGDEEFCYGVCYEGGVMSSDDEVMVLDDGGERGGGGSWLWGYKR